MRVFSTFSGIGGFEIGIQNAYRSKNGAVETDSQGVTKERAGLFTKTGQGASAEGRSASERAGHQSDQRPFFVGYPEIDKYAISVFEKHFKGVKNYGDITKIKAEELPDFDCLVGGFPCQAFSIAGKRAGFADTRGTLFFDLARILRAKQPRLFVFENVKGLLSHDNGNTFKTIIAAIDELGYDAQWQVLNSKDYGVPQNRERIIIVGHLRGQPRPQVFPIGENDGISVAPGQPNGSQPQAQLSTTVRVGMATKADSTFVIENSARHKPRIYKKIAPTVQASYGTGGGHVPIVMPLIRKLTPMECERLQGFPDDWTKLGLDQSVSDTQRYKMCGNAVTTNVIQAVFERILV